MYKNKENWTVCDLNNFENCHLFDDNILQKELNFVKKLFNDCVPKQIKPWCSNKILFNKWSALIKWIDIAQEKKDDIKEYSSNKSVKTIAYERTITIIEFFTQSQKVSNLCFMLFYKNTINFIYILN